MSRCGCLDVEDIGCACYVDTHQNSGLDHFGTGSQASPYSFQLDSGIAGTNQWHRSTAWMSIPEFGVPGTATMVNNRAYAIPLSIGGPVPASNTAGWYALTDLAVEVTTAATAGNIRAGLYTSTTTGLPSSRDEDYGNPTTGGTATTTGVKQWAISPTLVSSFYRLQTMFLVLAPQGITGTLSMRVRTGWGQGILDPASTPVLNQSPNCYYSDTGFSGALPFTFGTVAGVSVAPTALIKSVGQS